MASAMEGAVAGGNSHDLSAMTKEGTVANKRAHATLLRSIL
jgi:hypothetical protein